MNERVQPVYLEDKLEEIREDGHLKYRSKSLPTWCPGCGYFSMADALTVALNRLGLDNKDVVVVSGIGCASRFPFREHLRVPHAARSGAAGGHGREDRQ
ncbi:hypothetical protein [Jhaorihella thermophila]|uniref:hypothetical protein n=1 Tax=Jhaorihella thermophila TaxID=488547 RepID=UPI00360A2835